jgi:hypothetical protein
MLHISNIDRFQANDRLIGQPPMTRSKRHTPCCAARCTSYFHAETAAHFRAAVITACGQALACWQQSPYAHMHTLYRRLRLQKPKPFALTTTGPPRKEHTLISNHPAASFCRSFFARAAFSCRSTAPRGPHNAALHAAELPSPPLSLLHPLTAPAEQATISQP